MSMAICCPERPHLSLGLCARCYQMRAARRRGVPPSANVNAAELDRIEKIVAGHAERKAAAITERQYARKQRLAQKRSVENGWRCKTLRQRYGITEADAERMKAEQGNCCAICKKENQLYVDHDHLTGAVRALLCPGCNSAIGLLEKRGHLLTAILDYLREHKSDSFESCCLAFLIAYEQRQTGEDDRPVVQERRAA